MTNLELFEYCRKNPEKFLDTNYMFVEKDPNLTSYVNKTKVIKNKLIAIKETLGKKRSDEVIEQLFNELQSELGDYANYSEFGAFVNACDSNIDEVHIDNFLLRKITELYLEKRDLNDIVPSEWIQALVDKGTSRKKGQAGENKLMAILKKQGFIKVKSIKEFNGSKKCFARCSAKGDFSNKGIKNYFGVKIGKGTQNKKLDLIIKLDRSIYFLEAKHLNTGGGGQDKQIKELIDVIKNKPGGDYHFVAFLDGIHSNTLLNASNLPKSSKTGKVSSQYKDIIKYLKSIGSNYWVNTAGFKKLLG